MISYISPCLGSESVVCPLRNFPVVPAAADRAPARVAVLFLQDFNVYESQFLFFVCGPTKDRVT